jgi:Fur family ferric uptake transcriptional regulator
MANKIAEILIAKNIKLTEQRKIIAQILNESGDHPDAEELHKRASAIDDKISIPTIYRTLKLFEEAGAIEKHDFGDGRSRYETSDGGHHDHLIDITTGKVIEFFNQEIENLQEQIATKYGYKLVDHRLELYCVPINKNKK